MRLVRSLVFVLIAIVTTPLRADPVLEYRTVLDGKVRLLTPTDFAPMSAEMLKLKYPRERPPSFVLTNDSASVNIAFSHTSSRAGAADLPKVHDYFHQTDATLMPSVEWIRDEIVSINGRDFIIREFRSHAVDTDVHNIMAITSLEGRILIIAFNTVQGLEEEWLPAGKKIIESIELLE